MGLLGAASILALAFLLSQDRRAVRIRVVAWGLGLQLLLALLVLRTRFAAVFETIGEVFNRAAAFANEGAVFVFGELAEPDSPLAATIAFQILPLVIVVSSLFAVLYYLGVMQRVVRGIALAMQRTLGVSGAEALNIAANVFMGQSEAPLTIRPYLARLTNSELMVVMTGGMATISGALLVAYVRIAGVPVEHMLTAVLMTAPACIMLAKILVPETGRPETYGTVPKETGQGHVNLIDAAARGASEGLYLALNIGAVLIAFVGLIAIANGFLGWFKEATGAAWAPAGLQDILAPLFAPVAFLLGISWQDAPAVGNLLGTRLILNEFVAYVELGEIKDALAPRSFLIAAYALCGFANLGSVGIQVGGIASLIPERRADLARLGLRAMLAATLANFLTAALAGLLV